MKDYKFLCLAILTALALGACTRSYHQYSPTPFALKTANGSAKINTQPLNSSPVPSLTPIVHQALEASQTAASPSAQLAFTPGPWCTPGAPDARGATPSAPGLRVIFVGDGDLYQWHEGGAAGSNLAQRLTKTSDVETANLSPDGQVIAYTRRVDEDHVELWAMEFDGQHEHRLVSVEDFTRMGNVPDALGIQPTALTWVPNSHTLAFSTFPIYRTLSVFEPDDLWMVEADNGQQRSFSPAGGEYIFSPDGSQVVFYSGEGLRLVNTDGSNPRTISLTGYKPYGMGETNAYDAPSWTEDGRNLLVITSDTKDWFAPQANITVWSIPASRPDPVALGTFSGTPSSFKFSPNGKWLAFTRMSNAEQSRRELYLASLAGTQAFQYAAGQGLELLGWSPDSQAFSFDWTGTNSPMLGEVCQSFHPLAGENTKTKYLDVSPLDAYRALFVSGREGYWKLNYGSAAGTVQPLSDEMQSISYWFTRPTSP